MSFKRQLTLWLVLVTGAAMRPDTAAAQIQTGSITGSVRDEQQSLLPGVTVTLESDALIRPQTAVTDERGIYTIIALPPGTYTLTFELQGFQPIEQDSIRVSIAAMATVDAVMRIAGVSESITVSGAAPTVDVKTTNVAVTFDKELLQNIPQANEIWSTVEAAPGATVGRYNVGGSQSAQQTGMQIHGSAPGQTEYANGGLKLNWPGGAGGSVAMYFNHDSLEEVNLMTNGAPAEVGTGGVYMNMVTKSGGNNFRGASSIFWEDDSFQGDNVSPELLAQGITGNPINFLYNANANIGGPVVRERMWFFGSFLRYDINTDIIGIVRPDGSPGRDVNHQTNWTGKVTTQVNNQHQLTLEYNWNMQNRFYRRPTTDLVEEIASFRQDPEPAWTLQGQWTMAPSSRIFLDLRYGFLHQLAPTHYQPGVTPDDRAVQDIILRTLRQAATRDNLNFAKRHQVNASATFSLGAHQIKSGYEFGHVLNQDTTFTYGNVTLRYANGVPVEVQTYNTPVNGKNNINTMAAYAQDSWSLGPLTLNYGVRYERFVGYTPAQELVGNQFFPARSFAEIHDVPNWDDFVWRLGGSYAIGSANKTAVKGFFGRYMLQDGTRLVAQVNPATVAGDYRSWDGRNPNGTLLPSDLGPPTRPFGGNVNKIDPDINRPRSDEFVLGIQHELVRSVTIGVDYFHRKNSQRFSGLNRAVPPTAYTPVTVEGPEGPVTVLNQDPTTLGLADRLITNIPGLSDTYDGVELTVAKRMTGRWEVLGSVTIGKNEGLYDRGLNSTLR